MPCFSSQYTLILILYFLSTLSSLCLCITVACDNNYLQHFCKNATSNTAKSFQFHRDQVLSTLVSNGTRDNSFYNATAGGQISDETVYGLFLCCGDLSKDACSECVAAVASDVVERCPIGKEVVIWYDYCMIRYSDYSFFSIDEESPWVLMWNKENVTQEGDAFVASFNYVVGLTMNRLVQKVTSATKKFATQESNITASNGKLMYSLGQCRQDLSTADCNRCLGRVIANLPNIVTGKTGGRYLSSSCNFRFDLAPFYTLQAPVEEALPLPRTLEGKK
ncbi:putative Gnk2-like domain-containing protein [Rosa chinensis]|uniref:Putative Gnk2-like domain-containing protein n=1 Tax=Rosa chinensis TaxID=74649 RepID=A0A2P6RSP5_ROSCH|nr:putative Gnk2-like domain-containing protein [Rosa chinensis]